MTTLTHDHSHFLPTSAGSWWTVLLRGVAAILFGIVALVSPGLTLAVLILVYGAYALVDGVIALFSAATGRAKAIPTWWLVLIGLLGIATGAVTLLWPGLTALVLALFIGIWAVVHGVFEIVGAFALRKEVGVEWWLVAAGVVSVLFGGFILTSPGAGALALIWAIGIYSIVFGGLLVGCAFHLRKVRHA